MGGQEEVRCNAANEEGDPSRGRPHSVAVFVSRGMRRAYTRSLICFDKAGTFRGGRTTAWQLGYALPLRHA
jgi:hypothetical protein